MENFKVRGRNVYVCFISFALNSCSTSLYGVVSIHQAYQWVIDVHETEHETEYTD